MGRAGSSSGGHSSGGHSSSRSSGGHSISSSRSYSSGSSHSGGHFDGRSHIHNTYYYGGGGGYRGGGYFSGLWSFIKLAVIFVLLLVLFKSCFKTNTTNNTITDDYKINYSTKERYKLENVPDYNYDCVKDEIGWIEQTDILKKALKGFYDSTGIQPYIYLKAYDSSLITNDEKEKYANTYYEENFDSENVFLYVYFAESNADEDVGYMVYVNGEQVDSIMDSEAIGIFWDEIDRYWYSDIETDQMFILAFNNTASLIMNADLANKKIEEVKTQEKNSSSARKTIIIGTVVACIIILTLTLISKKKVKEENEKAESELIQRKIDAGTFKLSDLNKKDKNE